LVSALRVSRAWLLGTTTTCLGFTNLGPDVQDLFIEKVNPDNPNQYEVDGKWVDFETRSETILVGGGDP
jgi:penicillin amidase